jgi:hypothetical protein
LDAVDEDAARSHSVEPTIKMPLVREPVPFVTRWRSRTVANMDSITFDVRFAGSNTVSGNVRGCKLSLALRSAAAITRTTSDA